MEGIILGMSSTPQVGWAMWYRSKVVIILDEVIAQIRAAPTETPGWFAEESGQVWKHRFPITPTSIRSGSLALNHPVWNLMPNSWWKFLIDIPAVSWEMVDELSRQRQPSVVPH